jgi:formamidopyrimidine-DNA glycosylase
MPEMPEVETTRRDLESRITGRTIADVWVAEGSPQPQAPLTPEQFRDAVRGRTIERLDRRGKYLIAVLSGGLCLILHRRMTGNLVLRGRDVPHDRFLRGIITLDDGVELHWDDQRRFGTWVLTEDPAAALCAIGPEPLDPAWTAGDLATALRGRTAPIKATLLDQRRVAGLGNIYVDEALHGAGVHPARAAGSLTAEEIVRLHACIRAVLEKAIRLQGSSRQHHVGGLGQKGTMQEEWRVYDRGGQPCYACGTAIEKTRVAGRGTHACPSCQREGTGNREQGTGQS